MKTTVPNVQENHDFSPAKCLKTDTCTEDKVKELESSHYVGAWRGAPSPGERVEPYESFKACFCAWGLRLV